MEPIYGNTKPSPSLPPTGPSSSKNRHLRAAVVLLGLLSAALLIALIVIVFNYQHSVQLFYEQSALTANLTEERDMLNTSLMEKTKERDTLMKACPSGWTKFGCSCYLLSSETGSWEEGRGHCAGREATLVVIDSPGEQDFLSRYSSYTFAWIGLTDREEEGNWKWINGDPLTKKYWRSGQPDNGGGDRNLGEENCAHIISGGNWNDLPCNRSVAWFCEKIIQ